MVEYFVDTCVIVCYASNFGRVEEYGNDCDIFFGRDFDRITSKNVKKELERVKKRRLELYASIVDILNKGGDLSDVEADEKVRNHLQAIVEAVDDGRIEANVQNFRNIEMFFRNRCRNAINRKIRAIVDVEREYEKRYPGRRHEKVSWDGLLGNKIGNNDDGKVVIDCAILSSFRGKLILVTLDQKHILSKKKEIFSFINEYCSVVTDLPDPNFEIYHVVEVLV
ncbi:hypothetical protein DRP05_10515 [Archaeoglobales archaeon]|nr:MAG: hypothetical protein DRP05_10515 [Archaeoglobales archaeon]